MVDVHTCVFLLGKFDNSIPKDGVDHKVNVTHRHDWPNKNTSVPNSVSGKRKDFIYLSKFHKYGGYNVFSSGHPHLANHPLPPICICPLLPDPPPHPNVRTSIMDVPLSNCK